MRRWAFNLFCLVSLMIFAASVTLWVRSCFYGDTLFHIDWYGGAVEAGGRTGSAVYGIQSALGDLAVFYERDEAGELAVSLTWFDVMPAGWWHERLPPRPLIRVPSPTTVCDFRAGSFQLQRQIEERPPGNLKKWTLVLPLWLFLPFGIPPVVWWRKRRKNRGRGFPVQAASQTPAELKT